VATATAPVGKSCFCGRVARAERTDLDLLAQEFAATHHGVVTRDELRVLGFSDSRISRRLRTGHLVRLHAGVFRVPAAPNSPLQEIYSACKWLGPNAFASHRSAARVWRLGDLPSAARPEVTVVGIDRKSSDAVIVHRTTELLGCDRRMRNLIPITDPTRTVIDCCAVLSDHGAEAVMDDALHARYTTVERLSKRLDELAGCGRNGIGRARRLLERRIAEAERPESRLTRRVLRLIQASALPNPVSLHAVKLPDGRTLHPDLAYPDLLIAIEADSYKHHAREQGWLTDIDRDNFLQGMGWIVLRFTWKDVTTRPEYVIARIAEALRRRGLLVAGF
jgi:predicted transcriptional regulator of viral defense system